MNSEQDFSGLMQREGVQPIKQRDRLRAGNFKSDEETLALRRQAATAGEGDSLTTGPIDWLHPLDPVGWCRDGVQAGVYRNLRLAKYTLDARLDLSGRSAAAAKDELLQFLTDCQRLNIRSALIAHGKSQQPQGAGNQLKSYLNLWLQSLPQVLAFHSAQPQHGGTGALYLLLQKSEQARLENLERHQRGRSS